MGTGFTHEPGVSGGLKVTDIKSGMGGGVNQAQRPRANVLSLQASGSMLVGRCCLHLEPTRSKQRPKITQVWPEKPRDWSTFKSVTIQPLKQGLTHLVYKGPAAKYFRLCRLRGSEPTFCVRRVCRPVNHGEEKGPSCHQL